VSPHEQLERGLVSGPDEPIEEVVVGNSIECGCDPTDERSEWGSRVHGGLR
jgi:hypothetical protein